MMFSPELTTASLAKSATISPVGFRGSTALGWKSLNHKLLRKLKFNICIIYLLPTCQVKLMEELSAKSIFRIKIEYEVLRKSRF